ncbi:MAG: hypothetical protein JOY96_10570 [Verrucomicrobia bacterium]|nr:hypothetical protein [Verrucomicrobiota bacterium]
MQSLGSLAIGFVLGWLWTQVCGSVSLSTPSLVFTAGLLATAFQMSFGEWIYACILTLGIVLGGIALFFLRACLFNSLEVEDK